MKNCSVRSRDLIEDLSRRRRRGNKGRFNHVAFEEPRRGCGFSDRAGMGLGAAAAVAVFFRQRRSPERNQRVHARLEQSIQEPFNLRELLSEQGRGRLVRQRGSKFVETKIEFVGKFHSVCARFLRDARSWPRANAIEIHLAPSAEQEGRALLVRLSTWPARPRNPPRAPSSCAGFLRSDKAPAARGDSTPRRFAGNGVEASFQSPFALEQEPNGAKRADARARSERCRESDSHETSSWELDWFAQVEAEFVGKGPFRVVRRRGLDHFAPGCSDQSRTRANRPDSENSRRRLPVVSG